MAFIVWSLWSATSCVVAQEVESASIGSSGQLAEAVAAPVASATRTLPRWTLQLPAADPVLFIGAESFDSAGVGAGAMAYPAPNAAGLIAAVIVHGLLNEAAKSAQKVKLQEEANRILLPYKSILATYTHSELARNAQSPNDAAGEAWQIRSVPVFALTQDQTALILDNEVRVTRAGSPSYESVIRVVSAPLDQSDPVTHWSRDNGAALRQLAGQLFREATELAVSMAAKTLPPSSEKQQTFRYHEGKVSKVERASLVLETCTRRVLLTLRDTLMSVPVGVDAEACSTPAIKSPVPEGKETGAAIAGA